MPLDGLELMYDGILRSYPVFASADESGGKRWESLRSRVIEHVTSLSNKQNLQVIAKYYTRIALSRLAELLNLDSVTTERTLAEQVVAGNVYARIDRPKGLVNFKAGLKSNQVLNSWMMNVEKLLVSVETVGHLIAKEEMLHRIKKVAA